MTQQTPSTLQTLVASGVLLIGVGLAAGAVSIPSAAGYGGVGPNFLPWLVSIALAVCGGFMLWESRTGGFRAMDDADAANDEIKPCWSGFAWVSAGLLANAALITTLGFILSCTLCFVLAVQGLRGAENKPDLRPAKLAKDTLIGMAIAAPVYWMFTKFLAINLPGLTLTGWL
ncbi:tripartite tricarboxylate transporter TctB family protein [Rhodoferax sp.]|uniref:tripartite tricarboxylate transporter TctB family protein n=1 Tax=Rhodoferax sp. TaxID=50421 RepID=UPI00374CB2BC